MYTLGASQELLAVYREVGELYELPVMLNSELITEVSGIPETDLDIDNEVLIDRIFLGNFKDYKEGKLAEYYSNSIRALEPGLNMLLIHPAFDDPEMQSITKDHPNFGATWRQIDLEYFSSLKCKTLLKEQGIKMISWKEIKKVLYP